MQNNKKIAILGGDMRQMIVAAMFAEKGIESAVWGTCPTEKLICEKLFQDKDKYNENGAVRCVDWRGALNGADAVILPLPLTTDGVRLNCSGALDSINGTYDVRLTEIIEKTDRNTLLFAGKIPGAVMRFAQEHNVRMIDYYEFEDFQIKNAVPTAEGAISIAMKELMITLSDTKSAVVGYGRIGRTLAQRLKAFGSEVACIARSKKDLSWAECDGCKPISLEAYKNAPERYDVIFNTVPHIIFDEALLAKINTDILFVDLASQNGGIDIISAKKLGINVIKALSLPGKTSPKTAGRIIYDTVSGILEEEGIL